ncbi:hypothetical protein [Algoriphagus sp.]|uniref:hypothetical protein n=1 Tax=Algoriphagus sp. TaxID=1872435 RepID=UPI00327E6222
MDSADKIKADFLSNKDKVKSYSPILRALWFDGNGDWSKAHAEVDGLEVKDAARVHAYLHRKEGDLWNADYWYGRADEARCTLSLEDEWAMLFIRFYK